MSKITPALNDQVVETAKKIYDTNKGETKKDFDKAYNQAIKEHGYSPAYFKKEMSKFAPMSDDDDFYFPEM